MAIFACGLPESFRGEVSPRNTRCQCAMSYTDFWESYAQVLPSKRHRAVGKETGKTSYIERFNNTLRQRVGRKGTQNLIFLKEIEQSHWRDLVLRASLQCLSSLLTITIQHYPVIYHKYLF